GKAPAAAPVARQRTARLPAAAAARGRRHAARAQRPRPARCPARLARRRAAGRRTRHAPARRALPTVAAGQRRRRFVVAGKTWREVRLMTLVYAAILILMMVPAVFVWPDL